MIKIIKEGHTTKKTEMDVAIGTVEAEGIMPTPLFNNSYKSHMDVLFHGNLSPLSIQSSSGRTHIIIKSGLRYMLLSYYGKVVF